MPKTLVILRQFRGTSKPWARPVLTENPEQFPLMKTVLGIHPDIDGQNGTGEAWKVVYVTSEPAYIALFEALVALDRASKEDNMHLQYLLAKMLNEAAFGGNPCHKGRVR